jgi:MFS family permease
MKQQHSKLLVPSILNFLSFLDNNLTIPIMALYASILGANPATAGFIIGLYSITNTPVNILSGRWIDRVGYKLPLVVGLLGSATSMFGYSLTRLPVHLALVRVIHGICGGLKSPAVMSTFTEYAEASQRGRAMGFYGLSLAAANLTGFGLSGVIVSRLGYEALFLFGAIMLAIGAVIALSLPKAKSHEGSIQKTSYRQDYQKIKGLLRKGGLFVSYSSIFAQYFVFGGVVTLLPLYVRNLGMDAFHVGMLLTMFTVVFIALQFPSGTLSDRIGRLKLVYAGLSLGTVSLIILPFITTFSMIVVVMALYGAAFGMLFPSVSALVADHAVRDERGMATGLFHALLTAGVAIGAPVMGGIGSIIGIELALALSPVILAIALAVALVISHRPKAFSM